MIFYRYYGSVIVSIFLAWFTKCYLCLQRCTDSFCKGSRHLPQDWYGVGPSSRKAYKTSMIVFVIINKAYTFQTFTRSYQPGMLVTLHSSTIGTKPSYGSQMYLEESKWWHAPLRLTSCPLKFCTIWHIRHRRRPSLMSWILNFWYPIPIWQLIWRRRQGLYYVPNCCCNAKYSRAL